MVPVYLNEWCLQTIGEEADSVGASVQFCLHMKTSQSAGSVDLSIRLAAADRWVDFCFAYPRGWLVLDCGAVSSNLWLDQSAALRSEELREWTRIACGYLLGYVERVSKTSLWRSKSYYLVREPPTLLNAQGTRAHARFYGQR